MASAWGNSWGSAWGNSWGSIATTPAQNIGGSWSPLKKGKRPKYWWEIDPTVIPDDIPLVDGLEELKAEEEALARVITELVGERAIEGTLRILRAYAQILEEQRLAKIESLKTLAKQKGKEYVSKHSLQHKVMVRKKKIMLLLN